MLHIVGNLTSKTGLENFNRGGVSSALPRRLDSKNIKSVATSPTLVGFELVGTVGFEDSVVEGSACSSSGAGAFDATQVKC